MPSAKDVDLLSSTVASVESSATVTTKSNALNFVSVRLPENAKDGHEIDIGCGVHKQNPAE